MEMIHLPIFYLKHNASESGFCLRLPVEPTQFHRVRRQGLALSIGFY
jgi:hypothetical protein